MAKVYLSAGHGGSDPGATAYGLREKDINLNIMTSCTEVLRSHNINVVNSRTTDEYDPVTSEVREANNSNADIAVSFHTNAGGGNGSEAYYHTSSSSGKRLAELGEKYMQELGQNSRGIKSGNHLYFIRATSMPAVLYECFFIDNDIDNNIGDTVSEQYKIGIAYAKAILEYLNIEYKEKPEDTEIDTSIYYNRYTGNSIRIDDVFRAIGVQSIYIGNWLNRKPVATANGINNYTGTASQNTMLISLAKNGILKKPQ